MSLLVSSLLVVTISAGCFVCATLVVSYTFRRPKHVSDDGGDVLIIAAHQDDCVIMAGEYAVYKANMSARVHIAYLTCGDSTCASVRSRTRYDEALQAWHTVGVPPEQIHFIGCPAAPTVE